MADRPDQVTGTSVARDAIDVAREPPGATQPAAISIGAIRVVVSSRPAMAETDIASWAITSIWQRGRQSRFSAIRAPIDGSTRRGRRFADADATRARGSSPPWSAGRRQVGPSVTCSYVLTYVRQLSPFIFTFPSPNQPRIVEYDHSDRTVAGHSSFPGVTGRNRKRFGTILGRRNDEWPLHRTRVRIMRRALSVPAGGTGGQSSTCRGAGGGGPQCEIDDMAGNWPRWCLGQH